MRIVELTLKAKDLAPLRTFYHDGFNLPIVEETDGKIAFKVGRSTLTFRRDASLVDSPRYHFAFNIPENQFAAAKAWLAERVEILTAKDNPSQDEFFFQHWNAHAVYFYDAAGNIDELIARHTLDNASDAPFSLLSISEIGVASDDILGELADLRSRLAGKFPLYQAEENENFMSIGDENGLIIMVKAGRLWYPNMEVPAVPLPVSVALTDLPDSDAGLFYIFDTES